MNRFVDFLKDVKVELSKVAWPTRDQTIQYTLVVIGLSFFIAIFLGGTDYVLQFILNRFIIK